LREAGFRGKILSGAEVAYPDVINSAGSAAEGVVFVDLEFDNSAADSMTRRFVSQYQRAFGRKPTTPSAIGFDGIMLMVRAYLSSGDDPERLINELANLKNIPTLNGSATVVSRDICYPFVLKTLRDGKPVLLANMES
jgi:ABC-type branched-subunit amino acid transport system substrate-binding protein